MSDGSKPSALGFLPPLSQPQNVAAAHISTTGARAQDCSSKDGNVCDATHAQMGPKGNENSLNKGGQARASQASSKLALTFPAKNPKIRVNATVSLSARGKQRLAQRAITGADAPARTHTPAPSPSSPPLASSSSGGASPGMRRSFTPSAPSPPLPVPPVSDWARSARLERDSGRRNLDLARALFRRVVLANPHNNLSFVADAECSPVDQLTALATRVAVSAFLLQETVLALPRHQQVLGPYVQMLLRAVLVPDSDEKDSKRQNVDGKIVRTNIAQALPDGTLAFPSILDGLQRIAAAESKTTGGLGGGNELPRVSPVFRSSLRTDDGESRSASPAPSSAGATVAVTMSSAVANTAERLRASVFEDEYLAALLTSGGDALSAEHLSHLMAPFARKPFCVALTELSQRVAFMAHTVRAQQLHVQKLPAIFAMTHVSWTRTLLHTVMRAWWKLCVERRVRSQKHRARWAQRWSTERVRVGIRRWRSVAAYTLQTAEADGAAKAAISEKKEVIRRYLLDVEHMQSTSRALTTSLEEKEEERRTMERTLAQLERSYRASLEKVRTADRVGTSLLNYLLLPSSEQSNAFFGPNIEPAADHEMGLSRDPSLQLLRQFETTPMQQQYMGSLRVLVEWANNRLLMEGKDTEEMCAMSPTQADLEVKRGKRASPAPGTAADAAEGDENANDDGENVETEPVFSELLPYRDASALLTARGALAPDEPEAGGGSEEHTNPHAFVPIPFYKYLVLMRCFKHVPAPSLTVATAVKATTERGGAVPGALQKEPPVENLTAVVGANGRDARAFEVHPNAPAIDTVRMVKTADAVVLESLRSLHHLTEQRAHNDGQLASVPEGFSSRPSPPLHSNSKADGGADPEEDGLVGMLPEDLRDTAEDVARILVDSYERLTGTACVVTPQQLLHRGRGVQLLFLAALFRHYTNWSVRCAQVEKAAVADAAAAAAAAAAAPSNSPPQVTAALLRAQVATETSSYLMEKRDGVGTYLGRRHLKYVDWFHPPSAHLQWAARVVSQRVWIALSFSALHRALYESTRLRPTLSLEEQDLTIGLVHSLSLKRLADVLPTSPDLTGQFYVGLVKTMELCFSRLRHVFCLYALPLDQIKKARKAAQAQGEGGSVDGNGSGSSTGASAGQTTSQDKVGDDTSDDDGDSSSSSQSNSRDSSAADESDEEAAENKKARRRANRSRGEKKNASSQSVLHITANSFWHLLCDAGVAGGDSRTTPTSVTLHRVAVFSILEHVVFRTLGSRTSIDGGARSSLTDGGGRRRTRSVFSRATKTKRARPTQVGTARLSPIFAHAILDERYVDLRHDRGTVCLDYDQFVEALVRCAHYWQVAQSSAVQYGAHSDAKGQQPGKSFMGRSRTSIVSSIVVPPSIAPGARRSLASAGPASLGVAPANLASTSPLMRNASGSRIRPPSAAPQPPPVHVFVRYEGSVGDRPPLSPQLFEMFIVDWILPHCLSGLGGSTSRSGANGVGSAFVPAALSRFRRAIREPSVRLLLAIHQDDLFRVFTRFCKPREAFGVRSALPPPFSYSSVPRATTVQHHRGSMASDTTAYGATSMPGATAKLRDVGIVAVMSFTEVEVMARELRWNQVPAAALQHCFLNVIADKTREDGTIFFTEFLDLLCAVSVYMEPNPMKPLAAKVEHFLNTRVLTAIKDD